MKMSDMSKSTFGHSLVIALQVKVFQHKKKSITMHRIKGTKLAIFCFLSYLVLSFMFQSVLLSCYHYLKAKFGMNFALLSFYIFECCEREIRLKMYFK